MTGTKSILDETYAFLGRHVIYPNDQSRIAHTLWILGSGFLGTDDIPVFDNYPILAFLSPEEDSGKTRALDVTELLAHNAINGGSHTAASLCREIDRQSWSRKSEQGDKWSFCLTAGTLCPANQERP